MKSLPRPVEIQTLIPERVLQLLLPIIIMRPSIFVVGLVDSIYYKSEELT